MKLPWAALEAPARRALLCHLLYWQGVAIGMAFFNIYLLRLGQGSLGKPAFFQIVCNGLITFGFALGSLIARRYSSAATYRWGLAGHLAFLVCVLALRERCVDYLIWIGIVQGMATGLYWQGWILMMVDLSDDTRRDAMLGMQQFVMYVANLTGAPLAAWWLSSHQDLSGYIWVFAASASLFLAAQVISLPLRTKALHGASSLMRLARIRKPKGWNEMVLSSLLMGLLSVSALFLAALVAFDSSGSEGGTGAYNWVNAAFGLASAWMVARLVKPETRLKALVWSGVAVALVTLPLAFNRSLPMMLIYGAGMAIALSFNNAPLFATHLKVLAHSKRFHFRRGDALTLREFFINAGRIAGFLFLLLAVEGMRSASLGWFFVAVGLCPLLNAYLVRKHA